MCGKIKLDMDESFDYTIDYIVILSIMDLLSFEYGEYISSI